MFDVGKYKMRSGRDAEVVAVRGEIAIGFIANDPGQVETWLAKTGAYHFGSSAESIFDLIDPNAKKPIKFEKWVSIYGESCGGYYIGVHNLLSDAKLVESESKIAITKVTIECMEGDNLD